MAKLFPKGLLTATDAVLEAFEVDLPGLRDARDEEVFAVVERVVLHRTDEREMLCAYVDESLTDHGIDVTALTTRHDLARHQLTGTWRKW